jgi:thioredoxin reductase
MTQNNYDAIVIGGGSAGLSAALMLVRARRKVLVLDGEAPRNRFAPHMHGVLTRDGYSPLALLADGRREVEGYGGEIRPGTAVRAVSTATGFEVTTDSGERLNARRLLVATGLRDDLPDLEGLADQWGTGAVACPYCDGWEVRDRRIGVLSTTSGGAHKAQMLRQWSDRVVYLTMGTHTLDASQRRAMTARGIDIDDRPLQRVVTDAGRFAGVQTTTDEVISLDAIFLNPTPRPLDELLIALGATTSELMGADFVTVDATGMTSVPGLWAAGNVVNPAAVVPAAMGAGAMAGAAINGDLILEEIETAVSAYDKRDVAA